MISNKPLKRVLELQPLSHDHHHGLQLCWKIRTGFSKQVEVERIKNYADWFFTNHLVPHFELEEKYIFTILDQKNEFVKQALTDHRRLKRLFSETTNLSNMGVCVETQDMADFPPALAKIVNPGNINRSMLYYRLNTENESYRMPLLGRSKIHQEGVDLIQEWINSLAPCN